jgi:hypothetical protein
MRYLEYCEPYEDSTNIIRVTVEEAIKRIKTTAYRHGYTYSNDEEALQDFIADNWAYWVDEKNEEG